MSRQAEDNRCSVCTGTMTPAEWDVAHGDEDAEDDEDQRCHAQCCTWCHDPRVLDPDATMTARVSDNYEGVSE